MHVLLLDRRSGRPLGSVEITEICGRSFRVDRGREREKGQFSRGKREKGACARASHSPCATFPVRTLKVPSREVVGRAIAFFCTKVGSLPLPDLSSSSPRNALFPLPLTRPWTNTSNAARELIFHFAPACLTYDSGLSSGQVRHSRALIDVRVTGSALIAGELLSSVSALVQSWRFNRPSL